MVLNTEKRARLVEVLSIRDDATAKVGASARPASPAPQIAPMPPSTQTLLHLRMVSRVYLSQPLALPLSFPWSFSKS